MYLLSESLLEEQVRYDRECPLGLATQFISDLNKNRCIRVVGSTMQRGWVEKRKTGVKVKRRRKMRQ